MRYDNPSLAGGWRAAAAWTVALLMLSCAPAGRPASDVASPQSSPMATGPSTRPQAQPQASGAKALREVHRIQVTSNDKALRTVVEDKVQDAGGPAVVASAESPQAVLALEILCGSDFTFTYVEVLHAECNKWDPEDLTARATAPERTQAGCEASLTLVSGGKTLWWHKERRQLKDSQDAILLADKMIQRFVKDWRRARNG